MDTIGTENRIRTLDSSEEGENTNGCFCFNMVYGWINNKFDMHYGYW